MITMNRCIATSPRKLRKLALLATVAAPLAACLLVSNTASAQPVQTQEEAARGGRNFPVGTLRGKFMVLNWPEIELDGQVERLSPGARIRNEQQMMVMPAAITGQKFLVNYTRDAAGLVREVWVLTPNEAKAKRESAEKPFLNFWPFVADTGPRDDGKTPYNELPRYGQ
ncbi:conserved exported hypothetical protein [Burkholderiales bacterium 8X]|nr:conserved exported hypothetical protein [Burkholderiales bacterium 8X]